MRTAATILLTLGVTVAAGTGYLIATQPEPVQPHPVVQVPHVEPEPVQPREVKA